jgi:hypothetical protein
VGGVAKSNTGSPDRFSNPASTIQSRSRSACDFVPKRATRARATRTIAPSSMVAMRRVRLARGGISEVAARGERSAGGPASGHAVGGGAASERLASGSRVNAPTN